MAIGENLPNHLQQIDGLNANVPPTAPAASMVVSARAAGRCLLVDGTAIILC